MRPRQPGPLPLVRRERSLSAPGAEFIQVMPRPLDEPTTTDLRMNVFVAARRGAGMGDENCAPSHPPSLTVGTMPRPAAPHTFPCKQRGVPPAQRAADR